MAPSVCVRASSRPIVMVWPALAPTWKTLLPKLPSSRTFPLKDVWVAMRSTSSRPHTRVRLLRPNLLESINRMLCAACCNMTCSTCAIARLML